MNSAFRVVLVGCFLVGAVALPQHNITVTVPDGFSNHGKDDLFCLPATWYQIATFFVINYGSHAVTIRSRPGQTYYHAARDIMFALLCPFSGVRRAIDSFGRSSWPSENHFVRAARAGALCMVVRNREWQVPRDSHIADKPSKQQLAGGTSNQEVQSDDSIDKSSKQQLVGAASVQEIQSGDNTEKPSKQQLVGAASIQEIQSGDSTDKPSKQQLVGAASIQEVQSGSSLQARFDEMKDRNSADEIEVYEDVQRGTIAEENDPSVNTASEGHDSSSQATLLPAEAHRSYRHIHGVCKLPRGYSLTRLPSNARIISDVGDKPGDLELCSSYNVPKAIIAIIQTIYASITLYSARGDQIQRYGCAAFGLTVLPYLIMSILNLFATSLIPDYSALYIIRSLELDEAITAGAQVDGAIGRIVQSAIEDDRFLTSNACKSLRSVTHVHSKIEVSCCPPIPFETTGAERRTTDWRFTIMFMVANVFGAIPVFIIGIWTNFDTGKSTTAQAFWTLNWLVVNVVYGPGLDVAFENYSRILPEKSNRVTRLPGFWRFSMALSPIPPIGGFVVVAQMLRSYGTCIEVPVVDS